MSEEIRLFRRQVVAHDTMAFTFTRPPGFNFKPGQTIDITLINPPETDAKGDRRTFSIVSAPAERELVIATRMRDSAFKRVLAKMEPGTAVQMDGPFGSLTLHGNRARTAVFIAGGIGITPFISIIRQVLRDGLPQAMTLLYSNRRPQDAAFLTELHELQQHLRGRLHLLPTMTGEAISGWGGRTGMIDSDFLRSAMETSSQPIFYVVGPPAMVSAMREQLNALGVQDDDIRSEDFAGY